MIKLLKSINPKDINFNYLFSESEEKYNHHQQEEEDNIESNQLNETATQFFK